MRAARVWLRHQPAALATLRRPQPSLPALARRRFASEQHDFAAEPCALPTELAQPRDELFVLSAHDDMIVEDGGSVSAAPTEKQLTFAKQLASQAGRSLPVEGFDTSAAVTVYIEELLQDGAANGATEKQMAFVKSLCQRKGQSFEALPGYRTQSKNACSALIEELLAMPDSASFKSNPGTQYAAAANSTALPTTAQLNFMAVLAREHEVGIPLEALLTKGGATSWIDGRVKSQKGGAADAAPQTSEVPF